MGYIERFMEFAQDRTDGGDAVIAVINFAQSCSISLYRINGNEIESDNEALTDDDAFSEIQMGAFDNFAKGIHLFQFLRGKCVDRRHIPHFNPELLYKGADYLTIWQEYGLEPQNDGYKKELEGAIKAEKIKNTLVYACYENDNDKIMHCLKNEKLSKSQLNKVLELCGTPLILCAKNDNLPAFKALVEKGADLGKKFSGGETPLRTALNHSYDIVMYIFVNYRGQFDKEVTKFTYAAYSKDVRVLQLLKEQGLDMNCTGSKFPPLHTFADYGNLVGIKFLLDNGVDINLRNQLGQTALERAERAGMKEAVELLKKYGG